MNFTRARNYRLYSAKHRVLDLSLDAGRCLLGHTPKGLSKNYKNSISRGLYVALGNSIHKRTIRCIQNFFETLGKSNIRSTNEILRGSNASEYQDDSFNRQFRVIIFPNRDQACKFLHLHTGIELSNVDFAQCYWSKPFQTESETDSASRLSLWRPFTPFDHKADIILPIFPQPGDISPQVLLYKEGDFPKPQNSAIMLHGLYHIVKLTELVLLYNRISSVSRLQHQPKKHRESLGVTNFLFSEDQWKRFIPAELQFWDRVSPYIFIKKTVIHSLEIDSLSKVWTTIAQNYAGLKIPPDPTCMLILPAIASYSEETLIRSFLSDLDREIRNL